MEVEDDDDDFARAARKSSTDNPDGTAPVAR